MTIKEALKKSVELLEKNNIEESILKAKIVLANLLEKPKEYLFINENEELDKKIEQDFFEKVNKLCNNIPLQYLTHIQQFYGLEFYVDNNVLIPRADTEILVEEVIKSIKDTKSDIKILDMCTGSGIIAIILATKFINKQGVETIQESKENTNTLNEEEDSMNVLKVTDDTFEQEVLKSNIPVLIDFYADWCGPCKMLSPIVDEVAAENDDIKVVKVNVDEAQNTAIKYQIMSIPTLVVIKNGNEVNRSVGVIDKDEIINMVK